MKREVAKMKKEGKAVLNAVTVPLAKFEVEVMVMTSSDPGCPLLDHAKEIIKDGGWNSFKLPHRSAADKHAR